LASSLLEFNDLFAAIISKRSDGNDEYEDKYIDTDDWGET
jgi:hypothetical protein